ATSPSPANLLVMGPWDHGGWVGSRCDGSSLGHVSFNAKTADFYREKIELPFFEFHLKGKGAFKHPKAWVFETGTNQWREHTTWPPRNTKPLTLYFHAGSRLAHEPPADSPAENSFADYLSDPAPPLPYLPQLP